MAKVVFGLANHVLSREENGLTFDVEGPSGKVGQLVVSKGGVRWYPRGTRKPNYATWKQFDRLMQQARIENEG